MKINHLIYFLQDMIVGGTDTTHVTLIFAMAELINHPEEMERVQQEVRKTVHTSDDINEDSIGKMIFLIKGCDQ